MIDVISVLTRARWSLQKKKAKQGQEVIYNCPFLTLWMKVTN